MGKAFPEIKEQKNLIKNVIQEEENSFLRTLSDGLKRLDIIIKDTKKIVNGKTSFELYDTYGFPLDLTKLILSENNLTLDIKGFNNEMKKQKIRSRKATKIKSLDWEIIIKKYNETNIGYNILESEIKITQHRRVNIKNKIFFQLVFNQTPFYPEGGGQVGDIGEISNAKESINIIDTKRENNLIIHISDKLPENINSIFTARVNKNIRKSSEKNHTATHLLQESLREILGTHVEQRGSLVCSDYLRFDFTHFSALTKVDLELIEKSVNDKIKRNINLKEHVNISMLDAKSLGAIMLFGEKYNDKVRAVQFENSIELCGGTHVKNTSEIQFFKIKNESSSSSGIRRIEAITGNKVMEYYNNIENQLKDIASQIKNKDVIKGNRELVNEKKILIKQNESYRNRELNMLEEVLLKNTIKINSIRVISKEVKVDLEDMKNLSFRWKKNQENLAVHLISKINNKVISTIMLTDDLVRKGLNAVDIIKEVSKEFKGGGGGQSFFATSGGTDSSKINNAIEKFKELI